MTITSGNHPKSLWPGVKAFFGKSYKEKPAVSAMIFDAMTSDKSYEEIVEETGFGLAPQKAEGAGIQYDTDSQGYVTRFTNVTYGLGGVITREAMEDNQYESVATRKASKLARSMRQTRENVHANILNRFTTAGYVGGDGVVLGSASHPSLIGNQSNILGVAADLSEASLEDLLIQIRQATDNRGLRIQLEGVKLIVAPQESFNATRIVSSTNQSGTANNDINATKAMGMLPGGVVVWDYLSDADAWFIKTDAPEGLMTFNRRAVALTQDNDFDTENAKMKATERYACGWGDWRGIFGSVGA